MINGADKHALSSLLLRLSQLGSNFKSCLLSRRKKPYIWLKKTAVSVPVGFGKNEVSVLKIVTALKFCEYITSAMRTTTLQAQRRVFYFFAMQDIARILWKVSTTFSQFLVEASLPWQRVNGNVRKQTRGMSFTFISARINDKLLQYHSCHYFTKCKKFPSPLTPRCGRS